MKANILSIDGGGIRGILPAKALVYLEEKLISHNKNTRLCDYFDLITGTSTGGIIAALLTVPDDRGRPLFKAKDALQLYVENGGKIFDVSIWKKISSFGGVADEKYSASYLEKVLEKYLGKTMLSQTVKPLMITAYDIRNRAAKFFTTTDSVKNSNRDFYLKDVCRATSAAPSYFEPARISSTTDIPFALVDGGMFANNPAMTAYAEARSTDFRKLCDSDAKPSYPTASEMFMLSIGTGSVKKPYFYEQAKDWGELQWIKPVIDMLMSGNAETVDYELKQIFSTCAEPGNYVRIVPDLRGVNPEMDDASDKNIKALLDAGDRFVDENKEILDNVANKLIHLNK